MKKINLSVLFALASLTIAAQPYGQHLYTHAGSRLNTGLFTNINSTGFFMMGTKNPATGAPYNFNIDKTDANGALAGSSFIQKQYQIISSQGCTAPMAQLMVGCSVSGIETYVPGGTPAWYAITGAYNSNIFFATLDQAGIPITQVEYSFPGGYGSSKPIIIETSVPNEYIIAGGGGNMAWAMRVDANGTILWSNLYAHPDIGLIEVNDMIESPYRPEVLLVGHMVHPQAVIRASDGFILRMDVNNGNLMGFDCYGGPGNSCDSFQGITVANSNAGGTPGFAIAGSMDYYQCTGQSWILKVDPAGAIVWTTEFSPSTDIFARQTVDLVERPNNGTYEYYVAFNSNNSNLGVAKFDDMGNPFPGGVNNEFTYFLGSSWVTAISFNGVAGGPCEGIHVYGTDLGGTGHNMVQAYFNGESGCNEFLTTMNACNGPNSIVSPPMLQFGQLTPCNQFRLDPVIYDDYGVSNACLAASLPGGSNAREAYTTGLKDQTNENNFMSVNPNPVLTNAILRYEIKKSANLKVELFNNLGQLVKVIQPMVSKATGSYSLALDLDQYNLEAGIYFVQITNNGEITQEKIVYNK